MPTIFALLTDDMLNSGREGEDIARYIAACDQMRREAGNAPIVGTGPDGGVIAAYKITCINGLSLLDVRCMQVVSVCFSAVQRGHGDVSVMFDDAFARVRKRVARSSS